jgi:iron complex outermembrane recepter protein
MIYFLSVPPRPKRIFRLAFTALVFAALHTPSFSQETDPSLGDGVSKQLDTITVTANKTVENLQETSLSMTVLDDLSIEDKQIDNLNDLGDFVPNLLIFSDGPAGVNSPGMRGIHADAESLSVSTGLFIDEIPVSNTLGFGSDAFLDIERIEVLRGPQGTLYGKNTEVGAINIITRLPDNEFMAKISTKIGTNTQSTSFNMSGPISRDKLFFGLSGQYRTEDGFIEHTELGGEVDDREHIYGKGQLRWTPREDFEVRLIMNHIQYDNGANRMGPNPEWWSGYLPLVPGDREVSSDHEGSGTAVENSQALKVSYDINQALALTSTTTHRVFDDNRNVDIDLTSADFMWRDFDSTYQTITQEFRLAYDNGGWKWLTGIYFDKNDYHIKEQASSTPRDYEIDGYSYAVFGQATVPLTTRLSAICGLRYEDQQTDFTDNLSGSELDGSWDDISPKIALQYHFTPQIMGYTSISKGYRSGGINYHWIDPDKTTYEAEQLWSYEVGAKTQLLNNRLLFNSAAYYMDIKDMQVYEGYPPMRLDISNSAQAMGYGVEFDIQALITRHLTLDASLGYTNVEYKDFTESGTSYDGNKSTFAPEYTFNIGTQYRMETGFYARVDLVGYGRMYLDKANNYARDPYELMNAKIGYETEDIDIYLYGKNLFDTKYDTVGYYGGMFILYSDPREIGLALTYRF